MLILEERPPSPLLLICFGFDRSFIQERRKTKLKMKTMFLKAAQGVEEVLRAKNSRDGFVM